MFTNPNPHSNQPLSESNLAAENVNDLHTPVRELYASGEAHVAVRVRLVIGLVV